MLRVIKAGKLEDIERQEREYEEKLAPIKQKSEEQWTAYRTAEHEAQNVVRQAILDQIGHTTLDLDVRVDEVYKGGYEARISANDRNHFDDKIALSWHWQAKLQDGAVKYESGSWSGLKATTPEQLADLEESVRVLRILQHMDWPTLLDRDSAKTDYSKFVDSENEKQLYDLQNNKPNFAQMKAEAALEDIIGTNKVVYVSGLPDSNYRSGYFTGYLQLVSETPSSYNVRMFSKYDVEFAADPEHKENSDYYKKYIKHQLENGSTYRKLKKNVIAAMSKPADIVDLDFVLQ